MGKLTPCSFPSPVSCHFCCVSLRLYLCLCVLILGFPVSADSPLAVLRSAGCIWRHQLLPTGQDDLPEDPVLRQQSGGEPQPDQIHSLPV